MNQICCISINHKYASVEVREQIHIDPKDLASIMSKDSEAYTLNTCNRTEIYWREIESSAVYTLVSSISGMSEDEIRKVSEFLTGKDAVWHLFAVAAGLDSLIIGEPQILGQVKDAYRTCLAENTPGTLLNKAIHRSFRAAKRIRTETDIGKYPVSVASEAVELACHIFGDITRSSVLVIGAGDMAGIAAKRLKSRGASSINIINRTHSVACDLAEELGGTAKPFESLKDELVSCDIVISSTGSPRPIITREMVEAVMKLRKNSPLFIIDIAVPRDVDPAAGKCYNCYLYDIDALKNIVDKHFSHREEQARKAHAILDEEVITFEKWVRSLNAHATIKDLFSLLDDCIAQQLAELPLDEEQQGLVEKTLRSSLKRLIHRPVSFLKKHPGIDYIEQTRRIFQLDEDYQDRHKR